MNHPTLVARHSPSADAPAALLRIVVVEDNTDARLMLEEILRLLGHEVVGASNGQAGVEAVLAHRPDLALVDLGLPDLDGCEVARRIRQQAAGGVRLVALTGFDDPESRARVREAGFDEHATKPVDLERLADLLQRQPAGG